MFKDPDLKNEQANELNQGIRNTTSEEYAGQKTQADSDAKDLYNKQKNTAKTDLFEDADKNLAKGEGRYGSINNRDYSTTLRLAREADAYNNRPMEHVERIGMTSVQDLGTGFDKPGIQTAETRAAQQAMNLDTNQKQLAQALQDAVNHKDLNAFMQTYKQLYGISLSRYDAEREMTRYQRQNEMQQVFTKSFGAWEREFGRYFTDQTSQAIYNLVKTNPQYATMLAASLGTATPPSQYNRIMQDFVDKSFMQLVEGGMSERDALSQVYHMQDIFELQNANVSEQALVQAQKLGRKLKAKQTAKSYYNKEA